MTPDLLCLQGRHSQPGEGWGVAHTLPVPSWGAEGAFCPLPGKQEEVPAGSVLTVLFGLAGHPPARGPH